MGTGVYLDDIDAVAAAQLAATKEQLSGSLERVRFAEAGLFFVVDRNGDIVAGPRSGGVDGIEQETDLVARLIGAAPPDGTIATLTDRARFGGDTQNWRFKVSSVGVNQWVLVAAVPADVLVESANELAIRQALLIALVLVVGLGVGIAASRRIVRPVRNLTDAAIALEGEQFEPTSLDGAAGRRDELGVLARAFRRMAAEVVERERTLRERVRRLEVVVDQRKVDQEINAIVETDFFRRLEAQAEILRRSDTPES